jgi:hypothetical protein
LNWIQDSNGTLNSCILDGNITIKLNDFNTACIIIKDAVVMLKRKADDEWDVAVVGTDPVQLKYSEEMTDTAIKYVLLDIQPQESFKESNVFSLQIFKGVLRIVVVESEEDNESINTTQFFLNLVEDIKDREESESYKLTVYYTILEPSDNASSSLTTKSSGLENRVALTPMVLRKNIISSVNSE